MTCIMLTCNSPESSSAYRRFPAAVEEGVSVALCRRRPRIRPGRTAMNQTAMGKRYGVNIKEGRWMGSMFGESFPIRKGISKFYCDKSKSFTSLSDASFCLFIKDIGKPDNSYTRKRKDLLAYNNCWDKNRNSILRSINGELSERPANPISALPQATTMSCSESNNSETSNSLLPGCCLPPLPPHARKAEVNEPSSPPLSEKFAPLWSFSV